MTIEVSSSQSRQREDGCVLTGGPLSAGEGWSHADDRLERLFEQRCDELAAQGRAHALAVDGPAGRVTYAELDARANRLARWLRHRRGVRAEDRIGLLLEQPVTSYVAMLAVLKAGAAYVPLDPAWPPDRVGYIATDARLKLVLSESAIESRAAAVPTVALDDDDLQTQIDTESSDRLPISNQAGELCYVIYTSGTTGRPKGVAVSHPSICNFVRVAAGCYGVDAHDRMYQGLTIAFDFSAEEIWVAWLAGATLVPKPTGGNLVGEELHEFLSGQRITALCCVPTLLATLEHDLPELRFLLVSGETCPQDLAARWHRRDRRFLNTYGPTEATVSATWAVLDPDKPVTVGLPLPTYSVVILDPDDDRMLPHGELGELGIAGIGLANGYLNRPELTAQKFIADFIGIDDNPSGRIYRTGDLARINDEREIEHHGRIDTQVKIRGYRIELTEIEAVLRQAPTIAQAAVSTCRALGGTDELVGYYVAAGAGAVDESAVYALLTEHLPEYMVPTYLHRMDALPVLPSGKLDRGALPEPSGARRLAALDGYAAPSSETEALLANELASVLAVERISVNSNFFSELGANSLLMARFIARLRRHGGELGTVSMKAVYEHPTVERLAAAIAPGATTANPAPWAEPTQPAPIGRPHFYLCAALQLLTFIAYIAIAAIVLDAGSGWLTGAHGALEVYGRAVALGTGVLLCTGALPIVAKWVLIGRFEPRRIRAWSIAYARFWIVKTLMISNPVAHLVVGSPLYSLYLRALGAKVGPRALILTHHFPVATDLVTIGADAVVRKEAFLNGYRAHDGLIEIGPVTVGERTFVGEGAVLDIYSELRDNAELAYASSLHAGQAIPPNAIWHGSPAQPAPAGYRYQTVARPAQPSRRGFVYALIRALALVTLAAPIEAGVLELLLTHPAMLGDLQIYDSTWIALAILAGVFVLSGALTVGLARLLTRLLEPGRVYPLYGFHYGVERLIAATSHNPFLTTLFGDSCAIPHYLRTLGWRMPEFEQTGSNFGLDVRQEIPALSEIGGGTLVSDGLSIMNGEYSSGSFRVMPVSIGKRNFLGNAISYPSGGRTGDDCLLATKVLVPTHGPVRSGVGLLGSPPFEIPRSVRRDHQFDHLAAPEERRRRLRAKTRHNAVTMLLYLIVWYVLLAGLVAISLSPLGGIGLTRFDGTVITALVEVAFVLALFVLVERAATGFRRLEPRLCSIYQREFWRHERYWKVAPTGYTRIFDGTPFKPLFWRLQGVPIGRRVLDDGLVIAERTLVQIGERCTFGPGSTLQSHSLEDGTFKSDLITVGDRCTVGTAALVNYGASIGDGAVVEPDAFVMKGSQVEPGARWRGNPATAVARPGEASA
jgi:non-ribosomal peptide synthetase-like protein